MRKLRLRLSRITPLKGCEQNQKSPGHRVTPAHPLFSVICIENEKSTCMCSMHAQPKGVNRSDFQRFGGGWEGSAFHFHAPTNAPGAVQHEVWDWQDSGSLWALPFPTVRRVRFLSPPDPSYCKILSGVTTEEGGHEK